MSIYTLLSTDYINDTFDDINTNFSYLESDKQFICNVQTAITDYTFTGTERSNSGFLVTTASNRTVNISPDLFTTWFEVTICKGTNNANTVTLDAQTGNNINGTQTFVITQYNEAVTLLKDWVDTWKIKSHYYPISGTNTGDETTWRIWTLINGSTDQPTPADTDIFAIGISSVLRKLTYANLKASLKTYFDSLTTTLTNKTMTGATNTLTASVLKSATTEISISGATAPTTGQVLTATNSTSANWTTPSVGWSIRRVFSIAWKIWATWTNVANTFVADWIFTISKVSLWYWTAWSGTLTVDVNKNGTTLFATTKPSITTTNQSSINSGTLTTTTLASGDVLTIDIDAVPWTPWTDLYVEIVYS